MGERQEYYGFGEGRRSRGEHNSPLKTVVDFVVLMISSVAALLLLMSFFAKHVNPNTAALFAFLGLVFPILYTVNIFCALYWVVRWKKWFFISIVVLLLGLVDVKLFFRPEIEKTHSQSTTERPELRVMSYNVMGFDKSFDNGQGSCAERVAELINDNAVDVVCMQEYVNNSENRDRLADALSGMTRVFRNVSPDAPDSYGFGMAIYSIYPVVRSGVVEVDSTHVRSLWADIKMSRDTIRLISNHLQSTSINQKDKNDLFTPRIVTDTLRNDKIHDLVQRLTDNYRLRAAQADSLAAFIAKSPYQTVVCGDFNDTPMSYVYHTISNGMIDTFVAKGRGTDATYNGFFNMFRIDYILVSDGFEVATYTPSETTVSDHRPVIVGLNLLKNKIITREER